VLNEQLSDPNLDEMDKALLWSYMVHCMTETDVEITCFKKIRAVGPRTDEKSVELRNILVRRLKQMQPQLFTAATIWSGVHDGRIHDTTSLNPFFDAVNTPNLMSLPHLAAQELLHQV
jgi:hypothetical protein